jgi:hypothetical protein
MNAMERKCHLLLGYRRLIDRTIWTSGFWGPQISCLKEKSNGSSSSLAHMQRVHVRVTNRPNRQQPATTTRGLGRNSDCIRERERNLLLLFFGWPRLVGVSVCVCPFCSFDSFLRAPELRVFLVCRCWSVGWLGHFVSLLLFLSAVNNAIELNTCWHTNN